MSEQEKAQEIITMETEDGEVFRLLVLDRLEWKGRCYAVVTEQEEEWDPEDEEAQDAEAGEEDEYDEEEDDDGDVMVFRTTPDGRGGEAFDPVEDGDELQDVFDLFRAAWDDYEFCDAE